MTRTSVRFAAVIALTAAAGCEPAADSTGSVRATSVVSPAETRRPNVVLVVADHPDLLGG